VHLDQVDFFGHMNQSRYAEHLELGRTDLLVRSGAWQRWRQAGVYPVVARQQITYRRELKPGQRFDIDTRAVGYDGRLVHFQGAMLVGDRVHAMGDVYLIFLGPDGVLDAHEVRRHTSDLVTEPLAIEDWVVGGK
jgi:acyl-CoA thioesterase FadM